MKYKVMMDADSGEYVGYDLSKVIAVTYPTETYSMWGFWLEFEHRSLPVNSSTWSEADCEDEYNKLMTAWMSV